MNNTNSSQQDSTKAFDTLARLYVKYCKPQVNPEWLSIKLRADTTLDDLEDKLLEIGAAIFDARHTAESKYLQDAEEARKIDQRIARTTKVLKTYPDNRGALKSKYNAIELKSLQTNTLQRSKTKFEQAENDALDFEQACHRLPESNPDHDRLAYLTNTYEERHDIISERLIGIGVIKTLSEHSPFISETVPTIPNLVTIGRSYNLE